jgi:hypothetical protein
MDNKNKKNPKFWKINKCKQCNIDIETLISKDKKFCSISCSNKFTANDKSRIDKIKKTKLKRYGSETYVNPDKAKQTCLKKYGVDNASKCEDIQKKINDTMTKKYGGHYFTTEEFKEKTKQTIGVDNVSQLDSTKQKVKDTVKNRYGVDNVFQSEDIKNVIKQSNIDKYGVEFPSQSPIIRKKIIKSHKRTFYEKLQSTHKLNLKVEPLFSLDEYINTDRQHLYKFKCLKCDAEFEDHIDGGHLPRCISCYPLNKGSICEHEIHNYISDLLGKDKVTTNRRDIISPKELDIVIEEFKIAIEYDSFYYHSFGTVGNDYHLNKTKDCEKIGYKLIHIFEDEWINKQEIVKSKLRHILKQDNSKPIYARDCVVKHINTNTKNNFLENNHIQGKDKSKIKLGLFHNDELVSVMTFSNNRIALGSQSKDGEYELSRFSTSCKVTGAAGKLFSFFKHQYNPVKITSYADRRYSCIDNSLYEKLGFVFDSYTPVNYWYVKNGYNIRHHRYNFRKSVISNKLQKFDNTLTEYENMQLNGYEKIYDCGCLKFIYTD